MSATPISVVIPVYNAQESLPLVYERVKAALDSDGREFELILVEDASADLSWAVIESLASEHSNVRGFKMIRNFGQHNALLCGIREARNPVIVTIDDDLQQPPEEIPRLVAELEKGYDVVYGNPVRKSHGFIRNFASSTIKTVLRRVMQNNSAQDVGPFRAFRTVLRKTFAEYRGPYVSIDVLLSWGARKYSAITFTSSPRQFGLSNYTFRKLFSHAIDILTGFSTFPLRLASFAGFLSMALGMATLGWVLSQYLIHGRSVPGFAFLASMIAIFSGVQLFALGVFGEYIARIHVRLLDRPTYIVDLSTEALEGSYVASYKARKAGQLE